MRNSFSGTVFEAFRLEKRGLGAVLAVASAAMFALAILNGGATVHSGSYVLVAASGLLTALYLALVGLRVPPPGWVPVVAGGLVVGTALTMIVLEPTTTVVVRGLAALAATGPMFTVGRRLDVGVSVVVGLLALFLPAVALGSTLVRAPFALDTVLGAALAITALVYFLVDESTEPVGNEELRGMISSPFEGAEVCTWIRDLRTNAIFNGGACEEFWAGDPPRSLEDLLSRLHAEDRSRLLDAFNRCIFESQPMDADVRLTGEGRAIRWVNVRGDLDRKHGSSQIVGVFFDVTARRLKEERLTASETLHEKIAENIPGIVYQMVRHTDGSREVPYISKSVLNIVGVTPDQVYRNPELLLQIVHPEEREEKEELAVRSMDDLTLLDWTGRIVRPSDGKVRWVHLVSMPTARSDGGILWDGVILDVTDVKLSEMELVQTKDRLEWLVRSSPVVIYSCSAKSPYPVTYLSDNAHEIFGFPVQDCLSDQYFLQRRIHPDDQEYAERMVASVPEKGFVRAEYRVRNDGGEYRWVRDEMRYVKGGAEGAIVGTILDVTDRREAQEALKLSDERFRAMSNASPLGVFMTDPEGSVVYVNKKLSDITGLPNQELLGPGLLALLHPDDEERASEAFHRSLAERGELAIQTCLLRPDHSSIWCSIKTAPMIDGEKLAGFVGTIEDVTERYELEQENEQSRIAAERANQAKSTFLSRISHELRTPLHAMLGFAQLLQMSNLDKDQKESAENILASGNHLLSLIRDVLDIARAESGELGISVSHVSIYPLLEEALLSLRPVAEERGISIDLRFSEEDQVTVLADRQRLKQILVNVLSNAVKYNRREGAVVVMCDVRPDGYVALNVRDTGEGIPPDKVDRLFTPFDRLGAEGSGIEGTGLGLALTKKLVEAMGGSVEVESDERTGTAVSINLRHAGSRQSGKAAVEIREEPPFYMPIGKQILLIEDSESNIKLMESVLQARPMYRLHIEKSGKAGLEWALQNRPDLVLLDMNLPDMVGLRLLERIKTEPMLAKSEVIVISATAEERQIERTKKHGAAAYLTKPLDVRELLTTVDSVLGATRT